MRMRMLGDQDGGRGRRDGAGGGIFGGRFGRVRGILRLKLRLL